LIGFERDGLPVTAGFTELGITAITFTYVNFRERERERQNVRELIKEKKNNNSV